MAVSERFRILGSPSRLRILDALLSAPRSGAELARVTGLEASNLSRHLSELERAGCISRTRRGREVRVEISDPSIAALCEVVCGALEARAAALHASFRAH